MRGSNLHIEHQRKTVERVREAESDTTKVDGQSDVILDEDVQTVNDGMNLGCAKSSWRRSHERSCLAPARQRNNE